MANLIMDDFTPLNRGFCAALRNKEYFLFFQDIFDVMNKIQHGLTKDGPLTDTYFLDKTFRATVAGQNWLKIRTLYDRGMAPFKYSSILVKNPALKGQELPHEEVEYAEFMNALNVVFPPPKGPDSDISAFAHYFKTRATTEDTADFIAAKEMLEVNCLHIASVYSAEDVAIQQKNPMKAIEIRDERMKKVRSLFSRGASNGMSGASQTMIDMVFSGDRSFRIPTHSGTGHQSFDAIIGGLHGIGMNLIIGGTGGGKTLFKTSIVSNMVINAMDNHLRAPDVWGWIGEDGQDSYVRRPLCNILNRVAADLGTPNFYLSELNAMLDKYPVLAEAALEIVNNYFCNTFWIKAPEKPQEKLNFTLINILNAFDARMDASGVKPSLIILDYFNLLKLPKGDSSANTAKDLSTMAHLIDDWAQQRKVSVLTSVQASSGGLQQARDGLKLLELEDQHESKSIAHSSRLVMSLLPHVVDWDERGMPREYKLAAKVLKNRNGRKLDIFLSDLNEGRNITFTETKVMSKAEWTKHKIAISEKEAALIGEGISDSIPGAMPKKQFGNNKQYGKQPFGQKPFGKTPFGGQRKGGGDNGQRSGGGNAGGGSDGGDGGKDNKPKAVVAIDTGEI
jgi:uncharacterized membrane protein YgcG